MLPPLFIPFSYLLQSVLVSLVGALELSHQLSQCAVGQRFVHQVLAAAHAQRAVAAVAVDAQHNMVEAVARKLGLKADGETLERRQPVGKVAGRHIGVKEGLVCRLDLFNELTLNAHLTKGKNIGVQICICLNLLESCD